MGEEDAEASSSEDTIVLTAEDMNKILEEVPDENSKQEEDDASS